MPQKPAIYAECTQEQYEALADAADKRNVAKKDVVLYALWEYTRNPAFFPLVSASKHETESTNEQEAAA